MTIRVNGGIITKQALTGSLRYFKMVGPFAWTVSDGTVNLPLLTNGGDPTVSSYFVVGKDQPVPKSAAERALAEITKKCTVTIIGLLGEYGATTEVHFAVENTSMGWGSDTPPYDVPPANTAEDPLAAAVQMQEAVQAIGIIDTYGSVGAVTDPLLVPVITPIDMVAVTITETTFILA